MKHPSSPMRFIAIGFRAVLFLTLAVGCTPGAPEAENPPDVAAVPEAQVFETTEYQIRVVTVADGLSYPYSMAFLPDGDMLFTEMEGRLRLIRDGELEQEPIGGVPEVNHTGASQGLMDVKLHPNFAENNLVYLTYNISGADGTTMALGRGTFDGTTLNDFEELFVADAWAMTMGRQNSRIVFAPDDMLYMTVSVGGGGPQTVRAQQMNDHAGKILRLNDDGTPAPGNPFVGRDGFRPEIFTIGHQNVHGLVVHPETGEVWDLEHGDEANILTPGGNYGWPYTSVGGSGSAAGGTPVPILPRPEGVELTEGEIIWRTPDIHPTGMMFYTGDRFPEWTGSLFVGGLATQQLHRVAFSPDGTDVRENLFSAIGEWLRDVRQGPDGLIYFTSYSHPDAAGQIRRIEPME